ncbi:replication protein A 32 kDa subunit-like isoform X2 [Larimichthys crocea]|uniref:replication protein A 32 kDa subunit-like isoform X2 n=1 Tax=Larimichthys crocea TaxID=215358 RepID=UPI000F5E1B2F|nr:replication protein A 32 kDa subunit-like isoform X2 [Larimichthys crocea]
MTSHKAMTSKRAALQILPCTVSQLLSASLVGGDTFGICDLDLNQVSVVGIIRGFAPFVTNVQYSVDDMTGPPLNVKQWVGEEDCDLMGFPSPGMYVKVIGSLRNFSGQRSVLAKYIRPIKDLNEITSHMLEVVHAHMEIFGKAFDVNMNATTVSLSETVCRGRGHPKGMSQSGLSTIQTEVLHVITKFSIRDVGISFEDLKTQLDFVSKRDLRAERPPSGLHLDVMKGDKPVEVSSIIFCSSNCGCDLADLSRELSNLSSQIQNQHQQSQQTHLHPDH